MINLSKASEYRDNLYKKASEGVKMSINKLVYAHFTAERFANKITVKEPTNFRNSQPYLHWHPHYELLIILEGDYAITSNTVTVKHNKPAVFFHPPYSLHSGNSNKDIPYHRIVLSVSRDVPKLFSRELLDMSVFDGADLIMAEPNKAELEEMCELTERIKRYSDNESASIMYAGLIFELMARIISEGRCERIVSRYSYIQELLSFIGEHLSDSLTIEELSQRYGVGKTKLCEDFKEAVGMTCKRYVYTMRMTRARDMLLAGSSIVLTALETGYSSEAHFVKAFREFFGVTPGKFLKTQRVNDNENVL